MSLRPPAVQGDPPPPPRAAVPSWFVDREQTRQTIRAICRRRGRAVGITTSLWGAGGFGKTTLATAASVHWRVRWRFRSRIYPVTIGRDVRGRAALAAKVAEVTRFITGDTTEFDDPDLAGAHLGRLLDRRPRTLLLLDDVWENEQLTPFLQGGRRCVRLVTTRNPRLLPVGAHAIHVDEMSPAQAAAVLTYNIPPLPRALVDDLLHTTGRWALLLRLTNRLIAEQTAAGADPVTTAERILARLRANGPAVVDDPAASWNLDNPHLRNQAVKASIEAATSLLPPGGPDRLAELGIFAEDEAVPISLVARLWQVTGALSEEQTRSLCRDLERLSLLTLIPQHGGRISLHDVVRDYLRNSLGNSNLTRVNGLLLDKIAATLPPAPPLAPDVPASGHAWWQLQEGYLLDHLIAHLLDADRTADAEAVAGDLRWVETRLSHRGPTAPWTDLTLIDTPHTRLLARSIRQIAHLLTPTDPPHAQTGILHSRLDHHPHWHTQITARQSDPALPPHLRNLWPLPDTPPNALQRTLTGHSGGVYSVAIAADGTWLATADFDTVRIWDRASGRCTTTLTGHTGYVHSVAISADGTWLATGGSEGTVRIWDRVSGRCTTTLTGHTNGVYSVAIAADGTWLATAGYGPVRIWDRVSGRCTTTFTGHTGLVSSVAISADGTWLATGGSEGTVRIWDRASGRCTTTLTGHTGGVSSVAISADGTWLATSSGSTVRIWDRAAGRCTTTFIANVGRVSSVAISADGTWLATGGFGPVQIWDRASGRCITTLTGHTDRANKVAISADGTWLATTSGGTVRIWDVILALSAQDSTRLEHAETAKSVAMSANGTWLATGGFGRVQIWDRASGRCTTTLTAHAGSVSSVAIAADGTWLATAGGGDGTVRIWDRASGRCTTTLTGHTGSVESVAIAADGAWLATADFDTVRIWDRASGRCTTTLTGSVSSVVISADGTWLATVSVGTVRIWDRASGRCTTTLTGHTGYVHSVAISADGTWLATGGSDGTVRIWDRVSGRCTTTLTGHTGSVESVAIAADGAWLATVGESEMRIWSVTEQRVVAIARAEGPLHSCVWAGDSRTVAATGERGLYLFTFVP
ncbi:hypothetical protein GCM10010358_70850 [Streptomyces minutiscleroticus]|uniref:NB-ARC domain-containing protein n=2 Tax=Streptomyces minutiscleroticus TaxID=68238 RepID=A0A918NYZ2_9ACTN|nr:hypothetical protein GCM10010358_70850 [Streptomyces minutiscleroticus]